MGILSEFKFEQMQLDFFYLSDEKSEPFFEIPKKF